MLAVLPFENRWLCRAGIFCRRHTEEVIARLARLRNGVIAQASSAHKKSAKRPGDRAGIGWVSLQGSSGDEASQPPRVGSRLTSAQDETYLWAETTTDSRPDLRVQSEIA
jgi:TolB-like protein